MMTRVVLRASASLRRVSVFCGALLVVFGTCMIGPAVIAAAVFTTGCDRSSSDASRTKPGASMRRSEVIAAPSSLADPSRKLPGRDSQQALASASADVKPRAPRVLCKGAPLDRDFPSQRVGHGEAPDEPVLGSSIRVGRGKWVWVNLWAAWCAPCKDELPLLFEWRDKLGDKLEFVFVSLDDDERQFLRFLQGQPSNGLRASYWLPEGKTRMAWLKAAGVEATPELPVQILVNPAGKIHCIIEGAVEPQDLVSVRKLLSSR